MSANPHFPHLASPITLGNVTVRNRLVFQPHFTALPTADGMPSPELCAYHVERARGGAGLIVDGNMAVMQEGTESRHVLAAWDPRVVPLYAPMTEQIHRHGAKVFGQLTHAGHDSLERPPHLLWGPTQMAEPSSNFVTKAMDERDIRRATDAFATAATNLMEAEFDGVEIKLGHDGLLRSFASPVFNRRTDAYGGSLENRMRLSVEVLRAVRDAVRPGAPVGVRLCLHEYTPGGYGLDHGLRMAEHLEATGLVDYFNCDAGSFSSFWAQIPPAAIPQGRFRELNQELKAVSDLPVIAFGRIKRPDLAEHMIAVGEADLIGMARQLIADPETPNKLLEGRAVEIRPCIACNDGCLYQVMQEKPVRCVHNPAAGQEAVLSERLLRPAERVKDVVVVGGGPAGMKVAEISAQRGHRVSVFEREDQLGGQARLAARQPWHDEFAEITAYLEAAIRRLGVEVWLNVLADANSLVEMRPDIIIIATGSQPNLPAGHAQEAADADAGTIARERGLGFVHDVAGLELDNVFSSDQVLRGAQLPAGRVLVIDANGHWEAAGTAEFLADAGHSVDIATRRHTVASDMEAANFELFGERCREKKIQLRPLTDVIAIERDRVALLDLVTTERHWEPYDAVVPVYPRRSRDDIYFELRDLLVSDDDTGVYVERIGDAAAPRLIQSNLVEAHRIGAML